MRLLCCLLLATGVAAILLQPAATPVVSRRSTAALMALPEPPDMLVRQISICAGNVKVKQDPRFLTMLPYQAQKLPLDYCSSWPIWVSNPGGKVPVARVPVPEADQWQHRDIHRQRREAPGYPCGLMATRNSQTCAGYPHQ